ncbi:MAG: BLUF domain-containing protein [Proteobacteria bacterium]|nr:BLUF domain-containing protein [Pseudomonadota bacterium]
MPQALFELVYNSIAVPGEFPEAELEHILIGARRTNAELGITGVLLYCRGEFVQLLEGPREAVEHVYHDIIVRDRRHRGVTLDWEQAVARRSFAGWSMGFARTGDPAAPGAAAMEGYLAGGISGLDLSGPASTGRTLLVSIYAQLEG